MNLTHPSFPIPNLFLYNTRFVFVSQPTPPFPLSHKPTFQRNPKKKKKRKNQIWMITSKNIFLYLHTTTDGRSQIHLHSLFEFCFPLVVKKKSCLWLKSLLHSFCSILYLQFSIDGGFLSNCRDPRILAVPTKTIKSFYSNCCRF